MGAAAQLGTTYYASLGMSQTLCHTHSIGIPLLYLRLLVLVEPVLVVSAVAGLHGAADAGAGRTAGLLHVLLDHSRPLIV
eukprot:6482018-Amphidinium_carterae.1